MKKCTQIKHSQLLRAHIYTVLIGVLQTRASILTGGEKLKQISGHDELGVLKKNLVSAVGEGREEGTKGDGMEKVGEGRVGTEPHKLWA